MFFRGRRGHVVTIFTFYPITRVLWSQNTKSANIDIVQKVYGEYLKTICALYYMLKFENKSPRVIEFFYCSLSPYFILYRPCFFSVRKLGFHDWGLIRKVWVTFVDMYWIFTLILRSVDDFLQTTRTHVSFAEIYKYFS